MSAAGSLVVFETRVPRKPYRTLPDLLTTNEIQYRIGNLKKYGEEISDDSTKKRFNQELDILISEIRRRGDPGAASTVQEALSQINERERAGVRQRRPDNRGVRKGTETKRGIKDNDLEISDTEKAKFSPKQLGLQFGKKAPKVKRDKSDVQARAQSTRMATTGWIGSSGRVVRNVDEARALPALIRKSAQEQIYTIATNKNGLVQDIHKYS